MQKWIYFLLIVLSFVLYGNSVYNDYAIDDEYVTSGYVQKGIAGIPEILTNRYGVKKAKIVLDYRPVALISYALEYQFFGKSPHTSHLINIILYAICLIVIYNILTSVLGLQKIHTWLPLIITIFYAIHPTHTEVVNSLKNRDELFSLLFGMLFIQYGYSFFSSSKNQIKDALLAIIFLVLSVISKMIGILYFPILILILFYYNLLKWNKWSYLFLTINLIVILVILASILPNIQRETYSFENSLIGVTDLSIILPTCFKIIFNYIKMMFLPYPLRFYYGYNLFPLESAFEPIVIISVITHLGLLIVGVTYTIKRKLIGLLILCYFASMVLYFNFPIPYTGMFSERAMFLSSLWFIAAFIIVIYTSLKKLNSAYANKAVVLLSIIAFVAYSFLTIQRNFYWKNAFTLITHDIQNLENSVNANYLCANILYKESNTTKDSIYGYTLAQKAATHYQQAINMYPYYPDYFYQLARIYRYKFNNIPKAENLFRSMLAVDSNYTGANFELGKIYFDRKDFKSSYPLLKKAYAANNSDSLTLFYLAQNALAVGDLNACYNINKQFLDLYPNIKYPYLNLGVYYSTILKDDSAVIYFEKAIELGDRNPDLINNLSIYFEKKQNKEKVVYYQKLLSQK